VESQRFFGFQQQQLFILELRDRRNQPPKPESLFEFYAFFNDMNAGPVLLSQLDSANFRSFQVSKFV
jgi:hypothetical protein